MLQLRLLLLVCFSTTLGQRRVLLGNKAELGQFPFIVSIQLNAPSFYVCSGSIITKKHVLTAAHCFTNYTSEAEVIVGTNNYNEGGQHHKIEITVLHFKFDTKEKINDIAIIKIKSIFQFNNVTQSICLRTSKLPPFSEVTVIGWGCDSPKLENNYPDYLLYAKIVTMSQKYCKGFWNGDIPETQFCTFSFFAQGLCSGDSGGPLVYQGAQVGISSYSSKCSNGLFDVFTNVSKYIVWIHKAMEYLETNPDQFVTIKIVNRPEEDISQLK